MPIRRLRLHTLVILILLCMGVLALALVLASFWMYRDVAYENRAGAIRDLLQTQADNITADLLDGQRIFALRLVRSNRFQDLWHSGDLPGLRRVLAEALQASPEANGGGLPLRQLRLLDRDLTPLVTTGDSKVPLGCPEVLVRAQEQPVGEGISRLCLLEKRASASVLIPLNGRELPTGYIEVVGDPVAALRRIADQPGLALRIERPGGRLLYESTNWPVWSRSENVLQVSYLARGDGADPIFTVRAATGINLLKQQLNDTRDFVLLVAGLIVAGAVLVALVLVRRLLRPLRDLQQAAERISASGAAALDLEPVEVRGPEEVATPIRSFNNMVERLKVLLIKSGEQSGRRREDRRKGDPERHRLPPEGDRRRR